MSEALITGVIQAPGFSGLNIQDSSVQLSSGYALEAFNCVIDKFGRIGARKGWLPVNTTQLSPAGNVRSIFELVKSDGNVTFSCANNKIYTGTTTLTNLTVYNTHFHTGTYSQSGTVITCSITSHGFTVGTSLYLTFGTGTATSGVYAVATVINGNSFTVTSNTAATTSGTITGCIDILTSYSITGDNWQIAAMPYNHGGNTSAHAIFAQKDHPTLVYHEIGTASHTHSDGYGLQRLGDIASLPAGYTTSTFTPNCALTSFGRLWVANITNDEQTVYFSDLQDPSNFTSGTAGSLDISTVIPTGDGIVALASHNGFLVIFCHRSILIYQNPKEPASMTLQDVIKGVGCIARDSVASVFNSDTMFLSETGVQSLGRLIQEKSMPLRDVSKNVRDDLIANIANENLVNVKGVYVASESFYLLSFPYTGYTYCFDTRGVLENGAARTTIWKDLNPTAFFVTENRTLYIGKQGYIGKYSGYIDHESPYRMSYYTNYFDFEQPSVIKILKKLSLIIIGSGIQYISVKWAFDYTTNYNTQLVSTKGAAVSEYNIGEYGIAHYSNGTSLDGVKLNVSGAGKVIQLGFETDINGSAMSIQKIDIAIKTGKIF
jgi:hypothetical protein